MRVKHTNPAVITTIKWTEDEKDVFIAGLDEVMNGDDWMDVLSEEIRATMISFSKEF